MSIWNFPPLMRHDTLTFPSALIVEPLLRDDDTELNVTVNSGVAVYDINITKPQGFRRTNEGVKVFCDGSELPDCRVPIFTDGGTHKVEVKFA